MSTNDPQRKIPSPADLDPKRAAARERALEQLGAEAAIREEINAREVEQHEHEHETPTPADVAPAITQGGIHRVPVVELSKEQRLRVEALHAARRVLGNPQAKDGEMPAGWAWQAVELASYIVTGEADGGPVEGDEQAVPEEGAVPGWIALDKPLPAGLPPHVAAALQELQGAFGPGGVLPSAEERAKRGRDYVEQYRDKPDGLKELNAQGHFPVDGSEPPRSEPLHDVHCNRWSFNTTTGQWAREASTLPQGPAPKGTTAGTWGTALAEFGPFHVCI
jgi:hypothetical protein